MNKNKETWFKWDYVCPYCDAHIEMTIKSTGDSHNEVCPKCYQPLILMSVVDATIDPIPTKKEETNMDTLTETPAQTITLDWLENDVVSTKTYAESDIRQFVSVNKNLTSKQNEWYLKESKLRTLLEEVYADSSDQETLAQIAEIFGVPLTKEIEVTVYLRVDATIEVDMADGDYDLEDLVSNQISVDGYGSELNISNWEVTQVEEGAY